MPATYSPTLNRLIEALRCLPSVGPKSAQRMAFYLLENHRKEGTALSTALAEAMETIQHCSLCRNFSETTLCQLCADARRDTKSLCITESPADVIAIENSGAHKGLYFVLMGHLSPLDGIGPEEIGIHHLKERFINEKFYEIILATNATMEGEATAHYIAELAKGFDIKVTQIAHGIPLGGELEYLNENTLSRALKDRSEV